MKCYSLSSPPFNTTTLQSTSSIILKPKPLYSLSQMALHEENPKNSHPPHLFLTLSLTTKEIKTTTTTSLLPPPSNKPNNNSPSNEPSLTLALSGDGYLHHVTNHVTCRQTSPHSVVSSFSAAGRVVKRERDNNSSEEAEAEAAEAEERVSSRISDEDEDGTNCRKKLRLTKEQSALLEESFKQHSTLNPKQKQVLARQLNLRARQVEVWFQNRRARTKLKQTEVDCEFLKKCYETLTDENKRLKKELQELKALKLAQPLYMPMPAATLTMCPSCERLGGNSGSDTTSNRSPFSMAPKPHFYNPFTNSSAAC